MNKILYHGTTLARYEMGIQAEGLRGDMPRHLKVDNQHMGHVYLCDDIKDAAFYALLTYAFDQTIPRFKEYNEISSRATVLAVNTKEIRREIEVDPERIEVEREYQKALSPKAFNWAKEFSMNGNWFRYKGIIPAKHVFAFKDIPWGVQPEFNKRLIASMATEKMFEQKVRSALSSQFADNFKSEVMQLEPDN